MKLAFKLPQTLVERAIAAYPWGPSGPYCHVEAVFDEWARPLIPAGMIHAGDPGGELCYSSTWGAPRKGCGFQNIKLTAPEWWSIDVGITPEEERAILAMAIRDNGKAYDWRGIAGFVFPPVPDDRHERFCSEECTRFVQRAGYFPSAVAVRTTPNGLAQLVETYFSTHGDFKK